MKNTLKVKQEVEILDNQPRLPMAMNPFKFILWLFIVSIIMLFAAWTSAFLVKKADGNWLEFEIPAILWVSSGIILVSSATMQWACYSAKKDNLDNAKLAMIITTLLAFAFLYTQWQGWQGLKAQNVFFAGNASGSFFYLLTVSHAVHIVAGIIFVLITLGKTFQYKVHGKNMILMENCATFWHFLDLLWIYLFVFLLLNH
jgi:cytochrome c oxidase subunit 3